MTRVRLEFALAGVFAVLAVLTALVPTWMEEVFKLDPDAGSGALEWTIVAAFGVLAVLAALLGRRSSVLFTTRQEMIACGSGFTSLLDPDDSRR